MHTTVIAYSSTDRYTFSIPKSMSPTYYDVVSMALESLGTFDRYEAVRGCNYLGAESRKELNFGLWSLENIFPLVDNPTFTLYINLGGVKGVPFGSACWKSHTYSLGLFMNSFVIDKVFGAYT